MAADNLDISCMSDFADYFSLTKKTVLALQKKGVADIQQLLQLKDAEITKLKLPAAQLKFLRAGILALRSEAATSSAAKSTPDPKSTRKAARNHLKTLTASPQQDSDDDDAWQDNLGLMQLSPGKQSFSDCAAQDQTQQLAFDPRSTLVLKARTTRTLHITDFLPDHVKRRRHPRTNLRLQATNTDAYTIVQDSDTTYAGLSIDEWGAANCRLMNELLASKQLKRQDMEFYLAYTTKIFELASKFTWPSILIFDQHYRELQAEYNMPWGSYAPQLELQLLQPKVIQQPASPRRLPPTFSAQEDCRMFKAKGSCTFGDNCKYRHVRPDKGQAEVPSVAKNG